MSQDIKKSTIEDNAEDINKYLCVNLAGKNYAVNIMRVKEIIEYMEVTPIPMMPDFFCGAINLRGHVVPVIDIAARMGIKETEIGRRTCIVVIEVRLQESAMSVGVLVDAVNRVADISRDRIETAPSFDGTLKTDFIEGMAKMDEGFIILLHVDKLLSLNDLNAIQSLKNSSLLDDVVSVETVEME